MYFDADLLQGVTRILETNAHAEEGLRRAILCTYNSEVGFGKAAFRRGLSPFALALAGC
jgi:hypothetical protein